MSGETTQKRRGRPRKTQIPDEELVRAVHESRGYFKGIAASFGIPISQAFALVKSSTAAMMAIEDERKARDERYEQLLDACAEAGGEKSIHFYLERRMPEKYGKQTPDVAVQVNAQLEINSFFEEARKSWGGGNGEQS